MDYAFEQEFHGTRMNAEQARERVYLEMQRPSSRFLPKLSIDGNQWCALFGEDLQNGVAGFGKSPEEAYANFDQNWFKHLEEGEGK